MRTEAQANRAIEQYGDAVRRVCFLHLKNYADVEDVFQEVFIKYITYQQEFDGDAHEKAWLLRVAINACKDVIKSFFRKKVKSIDDVGIEPFYLQDNDRQVIDAVLRLPPNYRDAVYLFYYEGYSAVEIARLLGKKENTVYSWLGRAREQLREQLGGEA